MLLALVAEIVTGQILSAPTPFSELVANVTTAAPGKPFEVALHMKLPAGWHNYYSNPGESGMPTTIAWTLPKGWEAGPIEWPTPKRIVLGGIPNFAYEGSLWLFTKITPAAKAAGRVTLSAKADWLLCSEACVPQHGAYRLSLQVGSKAVPTANHELKAAFQALPQRVSKFPVTAVTADKTIKLEVGQAVDEGEKVEFFPADPDFFGAEVPSLAGAAGGFTLSIPLSRYASKPPKRLTGVLVLPDKGRSYWIDSPVKS